MTCQMAIKMMLTFHLGSHFISLFVDTNYFMYNRQGPSFNSYDVTLTRTYDRQLYSAFAGVQFNSVFFILNRIIQDNN